MGAYVGQATPRELAVVPPGGIVPVHPDGAEDAVEVSARGTAQPAVPIGRRHVLRERFCRKVARDGRITDPDVHPLDIADGSVADELRSSNEVTTELASLLASHLKGDAGCRGGIGDGPPFIDGSGERLLAVDVDIPAARFHRVGRMRMVWCGDHDGVEIRGGKHLETILVGDAELAALVLGDSGHRRLPSSGADFGEPNQSDARCSHELVEEVLGSNAVADDAQSNGPRAAPKVSRPSRTAGR